MGYFKIALAGAALLAFSSGASAQLNAPLPTNTYITQNALDWAWANPLPGSGVNLAYQSGFGWRYPTLAELLTAPLATDFLFAGANVPFNGTDPISGATFSATNAAYTGAGACASPYFSDSSSFVHCDWQDGNGQLYGPWAGTPGAAGFADQLFVRGTMQAAVPEPGTWAMMLLGFGAIGGSMRARRRGKQMGKSITA